MNNKKYKLVGISLKNLQEKLQKVSYYIIDKKSMVGQRMLSLIDMRLRQAFLKSNELFRRRSIIMFGDFRQLLPVLNLLMYANNTLNDVAFKNELTAYKQFTEMYELNIVQWQSGESEEQQRFRDILLRLRDGNSNLADWNTLTN